MNKKSVCFFWLVFVIFSLFATGTQKNVIRTSYFDIIYLPESAESAALLAFYADGFADEICSFLNTRMKERIPIYLDPRVEELNAYYTGFPYSRIYLYDTVPLEGSLAVFSDSLLSVFYHELTHAISLTIRTPFWQFISEVFSDTVSINHFYTMPLSFIEGVTVSFESLKDQGPYGEGRLNDPRIKEILVQAKIEGKFPSWKEAAGARDVYPGANNSYIFGGFFSQWLQKKYGMETYARLWERGSGLHILKNGIQGQFKAMYKTSIEKEWELFYTSITIPPSIAPKPDPIQGTSEGLFTALAAGKSGLAWFNSNEDSVFFRDLEGRIHRLFRATRGIHRLSFSPDGTELLVSGYSVSGKNEYYEVRLFNIENKTFTGESWKGYKDASFAGSSGQILAVESKSQNSQLMLISRNNTTEPLVIFNAGPGLSFSLLFNPVAIDTHTIAFIGSNGLARNLVWVDISLPLDNPNRMGIWETNDQLPGLRYLSVSEKLGKTSLLVSYSGPQGLSRWASIDPISGSIAFQSVDYSGILSYPVYQEEFNSIFYIANYSDHKNIVSVPVEESYFSSQALTLSPIPLESQSQPIPHVSYPVLPYQGWKWFRDGVFLPSVKIELNETKNETSIWGFSYTTQDPTEFITLSLEPFIRLDPLFIDWTITTEFDANFCQLSLTGSDKIMPALFVYNPYRRLNVGSYVTKKISSWNMAHSFSGTAGFSFNGYSNDIFTDSSPYAVSFTSFSGLFSTELQLSTITKTSLSAFPLFRVTGKGLSASFLADFVQIIPDFSNSSVLQTAVLYRLPFLPLSLGISGAWGHDISFAPDFAVVSVSTAREFDTGIKRLVPIFTEYSNTKFSGYNSSMVGGCTAELDFLTLEIQKGIPLLPAYANRLIVTGGYRAAVFGYPEKAPLWLDSAYASVSFQGALLAGILSTLVLEGEAGYAFPLRGGDIEPFLSLRIGVGL